MSNMFEGVTETPKSKALAFTFQGRFDQPSSRRVKKGLRARISILQMGPKPANLRISLQNVRATSHTEGVP